jgi:hypothetical protein
LHQTGAAALLLLRACEKSVPANAFFLWGA